MAMKRWVSVCNGADSTLTNISNWLITSDNFRISIDNILTRMDNVRDDIVELDLGRDVLHPTLDERQARLDQLTVSRRCVISVVIVAQINVMLLLKNAAAALHTSSVTRVQLQLAE